MWYSNIAMKKQFIAVFVIVILGLTGLIVYLTRDIPSATNVSNIDVQEKEAIEEYSLFSNSLLEFTYPSSWLMFPEYNHYNKVVFKNSSGIQIGGVTCPLSEIGYEGYTTKYTSDKVLTNIQDGYAVPAVLIQRERMSGSSSHPTLGTIYFNDANHNLSCEIQIYTGESDNLEMAQLVFDTLVSRITNEKAQDGLVSRKDWGVSFVMPESWHVVETSQDKIILRFDIGTSFGDIITITHHKNVEYMTNTDNKFGSVTYFWNPELNDWFFNKDAESMIPNAGVVAQRAVPKYRTPIDNLPVFQGTQRWLTEIIPIGNYDFIVVNISGSGDTQPLRNLVQTIKRI
jgi:hypothetical protein